MVTSRILMSVEERERWIEREEALKNRMKNMSKEERKAYKFELDRIRNQIKYYDALIREMKTDMRPGGNPLMENL
jgi:hypothetical protein